MANDTTTHDTPWHLIIGAVMGIGGILTALLKVELIIERITRTFKHITKQTQETRQAMNIALEVLNLLPILLGGLTAAEKAHATGGSFTALIHAFIAGAASVLPSHAGTVTDLNG